MRPAAVENLLTRSELSRQHKRFEGTCSAFASLDERPPVRAGQTSGPRAVTLFFNDETGIWSAYEGNLTGYGRTEEEALADLRAVVAKATGSAQ